MTSVVINPFFDWGDDRPLRMPYNETVIYEAHVKGMTMRHPEVPPALRGTYSGLAHPAMIGHFPQLGVTAVELMPVHQFVHDATLDERGLRNYWGYNTIGFFAPHNGYASIGIRGEQVLEFKAMVQALHQAGIEVILDVVYNHTAEGNHLGPTLSFAGIDNQAVLPAGGRDPPLLLRHDRHRQHAQRPPPRLAAADHGLAPLLGDGDACGRVPVRPGRHAGPGVPRGRPASAFFDLINQDPVVAQVKLIAEPWDVGEGGYQVGGFPALWTEWNGKYRDTVRDFWRGGGGRLGEFALRFTGSSDLYEADDRRPIASINFVTSHDGFTLNDLVSYNEKHNVANGEDNRDGESHNRSWNCGAEGPTEDG